MSQAKETAAIDSIREQLEEKKVASETLSVEDMRQNLRDLSAVYAVREDATITAVDAGGVPSEWIVAQAARDDFTLLYFHGGGYALGSLETHHTITTELSHLLKARVLAADYRLAPESPYPAAVEDGVAAWRWLIEQEGIDPAKAAIAGDSAGGGLTVATMLSLKDKGLPLPAFGYLISPWVDLTGESKTLASNAKTDPMVDKEGLVAIAQMYLNGASAREPYASPLFGDLSGLPPLLVQATTAEVLLDDARLLTDRVNEAGGKATLQTWPDLVHVFQIAHSVLPEGAEAIGKAADFSKTIWR